MIKQAWMVLGLSAILFSSVSYAAEDEYILNIKDVKPSVLQKELGISQNLSMKLVAYQAEYGMPPSISDIKPNQFLSASDINVLRNRFNVKINVCKKNPAICKGNPVVVLPPERLMELKKLQQSGNK